MYIFGYFITITVEKAPLYVPLNNLGQQKEVMGVTNTGEECERDCK